MLLRGQEADAGAGARNGLREGLSRWELAPGLSCFKVSVEVGVPASLRPGDGRGVLRKWRKAVPQGVENVRSMGQVGGFALYKAWETGEHFHL